MVPDFTESMTITTIDLNRVTQRRERAKTVYPYWRRPETYKMLVDPELEKRARGQ